MTRVFVDTSALLAILNRDDAQHAAARAAFQRLAASSATLVTTSYVLAELYDLLGRRMGAEAVRQFRQAFTPLLAPQGGIWGVASRSPKSPIRAKSPNEATVRPGSAPSYQDWQFIYDGA